MKTNPVGTRLQHGIFLRQVFNIVLGLTLVQNAYAYPHPKGGDGGEAPKEAWTVSGCDSATKPRYALRDDMGLSHSYVETLHFYILNFDNSKSSDYFGELLFTDQQACKAAKERVMEWLHKPISKVTSDELNAGFGEEMRVPGQIKIEEKVAGRTKVNPRVCEVTYLRLTRLIRNDVEYLDVIPRDGGEGRRGDIGLTFDLTCKMQLDQASLTLQKVDLNPKPPKELSPKEEFFNRTITELEFDLRRCQAFVKYSEKTGWDIRQKESQTFESDGQHYRAAWTPDDLTEDMKMLTYIQDRLKSCAATPKNEVCQYLQKAELWNCMVKKIPIYWTELVRRHYRSIVDGKQLLDVWAPGVRKKDGTYNYDKIRWTEPTTTTGTAATR